MKSSGMIGLFLSGDTMVDACSGKLSFDEKESLFLFSFRRELRKKVSCYNKFVIVLGLDYSGVYSPVFLGL